MLDEFQLDIDPIWLRGTFLSERQSPSSGDATEVAANRARKWREDIGADEKQFSARLQSAGLTIEDFLRILADPQITAHDQDVALGWLNYLMIVFSDRYSLEPVPDLLPNHTLGVEYTFDGLPFKGLLIPFLRTAIGQLRQVVLDWQAHAPKAANLLNPKIEAELIQPLAQRLLDSALRTLILELNVARLQNQLVGSTPQERFEYFSEVWLGRKETQQALLQEYPMLARTLVTLCQHWVEAVSEFLSRLLADWTLIESQFSNQSDLGCLASVQTGISDPHNRGRAVVLLEFCHGLKLVYKPSHLAVSVQFQHLIRWLNEKQLPIPHRLMQIIDCGAYGWVEFVEAKDCLTRCEVERFYWRQGSYLALLYALNAVDFHYENLIASGEYPILVDLEALFHHTADIPVDDEIRDSAIFKASEILEQSVLRVGLLPRPLFDKDRRESIDLSGLGGERGQITPFDIPSLKKMFTDEMHIEYGQLKILGAKNLPGLDGHLVSATDFVEEVVSGFEATYDLIAQHRAAFAQCVRAFEDVYVRHVFRPTRLYAALLQEGCHPDYLRDGLAYDRLLDKLWVQVFTTTPDFQMLVPSEQHDLHLGDIPFFLAKPGTTHIWNSRGTCLPDFFKTNSLANVLEKIARLDHRDCQQQVDFIRKSFISRQAKSGIHPQIQIAKQAVQPLPAYSDDFVAAAIKVGEYLQASAIYGTKDVGWIGVDLDEGKDYARTIILPLSATLYQGVGGIALFYGYLAALTGRRDFEELAHLALEPARSFLKTPLVSSEPTGIGAFSGLTSVVYICHHLAKLWKDQSLYDEIMVSLDEIAKGIHLDDGLDILTGVAGALIVLSHVYRDTGEPRVLELIKLCGQRLMEKVVSVEPGVGWLTPLAECPLAGFSHGVAGFAWALLELTALTGDERYQTLASRSLAYERTLFVPQYNNWIDKRIISMDENSQLPHQFMTAWCHGAPGVALGRTLGLPYLDEPMIRDEIQTAIATTLRETVYTTSHCLCHGIAGNAEIIRFAAEKLNRPDWHQAAQKYAAHVAVQTLAGKWVCGLINMETPGLMLGVAGIGLSLLHFSAPAQVPSVLRLQPPLSS